MASLRWLKKNRKVKMTLGVALSLSNTWFTIEIQWAPAQVLATDIRITQGMGDSLSPPVCISLPLGGGVRKSIWQKKHQICCAACCAVLVSKQAESSFIYWLSNSKCLRLLSVAGRILHVHKFADVGRRGWCAADDALQEGRKSLSSKQTVFKKKSISVEYLFILL